MWNEVMRKIVAWLDPKFEKYRKKSQNAAKPKFTPKTFEEFIDVMRRTPESVLSKKDRKKIAAVMSFDDRRVDDICAPKKDMIFVNEKDYLGPLMLDKLYKSGFTYFPVVDAQNHVKGIIHTEALNTLEIREADKASKYIDKNIQYLHQTDSLEYAIDQMIKKNSMYFLVFNEREELTGFLTIEMILKYLFGKN